MDMRRIVLVDFYWTRDKDPRVPLGHAALVASLRTEPSLDVRSVVIAVNAPGTETALDVVCAHLANTTANEADVAIGAYVWGERDVQTLIAGLRARGFAGRIILGGPQISYTSAGLEQLYPDADLFIRGYGEDALRRVALTSERVAIPGVHYAGEVDRNEQAKVALDETPSPLLTGAVPLARQGFVRWETQRGCPFRCRFCQHREADARVVRRPLASERVMQEIDLLCALKVQEIAVLDPIFNIDSQAVAVLERFAENGFAGRLALQCRAEMVTPEFLDAAAKLDVKLELGLQTIHRGEGKAIGRNNNIAKVDEVLAALRERHIDHEVSIIFGLPEQTFASFIATVDWCLTRQVPVLRAFPLLLLRGTPLYHLRERWDLQVDDPTMGMVISSATFDHTDWLAMEHISNALKATERHHPRTANELMAKVTDMAVTGRWRPETG